MNRVSKRELFCTFTDTERTERTEELFNALDEQDGLEAAKAASAKEFKERLDRVGLDIRDMRRTIRDNGEFRLVECEWLMHHPNAGFKTLVRVDTGEIVQTCPMEQHELQDDLFEAATSQLDETVETIMTPPTADVLEFTEQGAEIARLPDAEVDKAIDEAIEAAIESTPADVVEIEKPKVRRPRGFDRPAGRGVM